MILKTFTLYTIRLKIKMNVVITAIYEKGVLRPIEKIDLPEHSEVTIIIQNQGDIIKESTNRPIGLLDGQEKFSISKDFKMTGEEFLYDN